MAKMQVDALIKSIKLLKPLSATAQKVLKLLDDPDSDIEEVKDAILLDPALTADILRISNSAYFAFRQKITSVRHAIILLGRKVIKKIIFTAQMGPVFKHQLKGYPGQENALWEHSLVAAVAAELIAERLGYQDKEQAYITGLLHDIGKLILDPYVEKAQKEIETALKEGKNPLKVEKELFDYDHAEIGGLIAENWQLPSSIKEAITYHHSPTEANEEVMLALITYLADSLAVSVCPAGFVTKPSTEASLLSELGLTLADMEEITLRVLAAKEEISTLS